MPTSSQCYSLNLAAVEDTAMAKLNEARIFIKASEQHEIMRIRVKMSNVNGQWYVRNVGGRLYDGNLTEQNNPWTFNSGGWFYIYFSSDDSTLFISRKDSLEHIQLTPYQEVSGGETMDDSPYISFDWNSLLNSGVKKIEIYDSPVIDPGFILQKTDLTLWYTKASKQHIDFDLFTRLLSLTKLFLIDMENLFGNTENIGRLTQMEELTLTNAPKMSGRLSDFAQCTNLQIIRLTGMTHITGDITDIYGLSSLTRLEVVNTGVAGDIKNLAGMRQNGNITFRASAHLCFNGIPLVNNNTYTFKFESDGSITLTSS